MKEGISERVWPVVVILVNFNTLEDTNNCIESLKKSTVKPYVILVDNASSNSALIEKQLVSYNDGLHLILNDENVGFGRANNIGITWALNNTSADYIFLLNNDTIVQPNTIEKLLEGFLIDDRIGLTTCKIVYYNNPNLIWYGGGYLNLKRGNPKVADFGIQATEGGANKSRYVTFASGCAMMFRRPVIEDIKGFDDRFFMYFEDVELCLRIKNKNYRIWYTSGTQIMHKVHASSNKSDKKLPALHPDNPKLDFYLYHCTRNLLLSMHEHSTKLQYLSFLLNYSLIMCYKNIRYFMKGRFSANITFLKALLAFTREKKQKS